MGNETEDWDVAAMGLCKYGFVMGRTGNRTESNTVLMRGSENGLRGLITVNSRQNCDDLVAGIASPTRNLLYYSV